MGRWVLAFTFLLIAVLAAFVVLSVTGVIDGPALLWSWAGRIDWLQPHLATYSRGQEAETWIDVYKRQTLKSFRLTARKGSTIKFGRRSV